MSEYMAYVPQVVYAASLAREAFCCLGDFRQLPAIVQSRHSILNEDIFEYTGIVKAVENNYGHDWLVMLDTQYRMHPKISGIASDFMYSGKLRSADHMKAQRQMIADEFPLASEPLCMVDLSDSLSICITTKDGSHVNLLADIIIMMLPGKREVQVLRHRLEGIPTILRMPAVILRPVFMDLMTVLKFGHFVVFEIILWQILWLDVAL